MTIDAISMSSTSYLRKQYGLKRGSVDFGKGSRGENFRMETNEYGYEYPMIDDVSGFGITLDFHYSQKAFNAEILNPFLALKFGELKDFNMARINYLRYFKSWWYWEGKNDKDS